MEEEKKVTVLGSSKKSAATTAWEAYGREMQQKTPERLEDAAKFLAGMISITLTLFANTLRKDGMVESAPTALKGIAVIWLLSLILAFLVIFPFWYQYRTDSAATIAKAHRKIVRTKYGLLAAATLLFLLALVLMLGVYLSVVDKWIG